MPKEEMKKTILRNVESKKDCANVQVLTEQQLQRNYELQQQQQQAMQNQQKQLQCEKRLSFDFDEDMLRKPQVLSSAQTLAEIEALKALKTLKIRDTQELTPKTKAAIAPHLTRKLNFAPDQVIYKNLVSLNVNDSILLPKTKPNLRKKYERTESNRLPVPDLADFLEPLPPLCVPFPQLSCQPEFCPPAYDCFDAFQNYYGTQHPYFY